ncbi:MAG: hypothetical protein EOM68_29490 [Spirochaetia bacterium]|nr:hypothetical protein [Spirochaetia bacterium]
MTRGATDALFKKLSSFRQFVSDPDLVEQVKQLEGDRLKKCRYEIRKIMQATKSLVERTGPPDKD